MKPKIILITAASILSLLFIARCKSSTKNDDNSVKAFLNNFNKALKGGNPDTIMLYFDIDYNKMATVFGILQGGHGSTFKSYPRFKFRLNIEDSKITFGPSGIADVGIPVTFTHDSIASGNSILNLRLSVADAKHIKIIQLNGGRFLKDYIAYENLVKSHTLTDKDIYAPITLASFKIAKELKTRYDSVLWFSHINEKTYYYVVKGTWNMDDYLTKDTAKTYQMGLVDPQLKEIIPPQYDLVHNIGGTFDALIEVEKDHKHGFYDLTGKLILPVEYDQVFPVRGGENLAALRKGDDYYWLKNDFSVSGKVDLKIGDIISNLKQEDSHTYKNDTTDNITEFNSRNNHGSLRIPPSYLVDLNILPAIKMFKNPLRKNVYFEEVSSSYVVKLDKKQEDTENWLAAAFYSIRDYYLGGRSEFYDTKNMIVLDKRRNKVYSYALNTDIGDEEGDGELTGICDDYTIKPLNDSLFELKASTALSLHLYNDDILNEAPYYHYLNLKNGKLVEMSTNRTFSFTKFRKMDDSYISGCYLYGIKSSTAKYGYADKQTNSLDNATLEYMKNEIFADYNYKFKDTLWTNLFQERMQNYKPENTNVDDSLSEIDKYNINWISQRLKVSSSKKLTANR